MELVSYLATRSWLLIPAVWRFSKQAWNTGTLNERDEQQAR